MANYNQNYVFQGLGTLTIGVPFAGSFFVEGKSSIPSIATGSSPSALLVVVNKNGSPVYTGQAGASGFYCTVDLIATDALTVVFSSANAVDAALNAVKTNVEFGVGK